MKKPLPRLAPTQGSTRTKPGVCWGLVAKLPTCQGGDPEGMSRPFSMTYGHWSQLFTPSIAPFTSFRPRSLGPIGAITHPTYHPHAPERRLEIANAISTSNPRNVRTARLVLRGERTLAHATESPGIGGRVWT